MVRPSTQELESGLWFKFSDETVVALPGKVLRLGEEEQVWSMCLPLLLLPPQQVQGRKGPKGAGGKGPGKGLQNSNNAYMLVYMLRESIAEIRRVEGAEQEKREEVARVAGREQEPEEKRRRLEQEPGQEYVWSNSRVFPLSFPRHLRTKIDRDNLECDEEHQVSYYSLAPTSCSLPPPGEGEIKTSSTSRMQEQAGPHDASVQVQTIWVMKKLDFQRPALGGRPPPRRRSHRRSIRLQF